MQTPLRCWFPGLGRRARQSAALPIHHHRSLSSSLVKQAKNLKHRGHEAPCGYPDHKKVSQQQSKYQKPINPHLGAVIGRIGLRQSGSLGFPVVGRINSLVIPRSSDSTPPVPTSPRERRRPTTRKTPAWKSIHPVHHFHHPASASN